jgi:hypothetical protein
MPRTTRELTVMRRFSVAATIVVAALTAVVLAPEHGVAQTQPQLLPLKPPPPPPVKPYTPVAATPPQPYGDPSFQAFRQQLADIAAHKDRAALAKLVVTQGFFWIQDKDHADPHKSGIDNLARAIDLDAKDGSGWDTVTGFVSDPTAAELPDHKGVICAPADPTLDLKAFQALIEATQTDPTDWGYPLKDGVEVRAAAAPNAAVIDKLGLNLVRVLPDTAPPQNPDQPAFLHVATPSGKSGFIAADTIAPLGGDQMCYAKDAGGWKIAGYFGGVSQ